MLPRAMYSEEVTMESNFWYAVWVGGAILGTISAEIRTRANRIWVTRWVRIPLKGVDFIALHLLRPAWRKQSLLDGIDPRA